VKSCALSLRARQSSLIAPFIVLIGGKKFAFSITSSGRAGRLRRTRENGRPIGSFDLDGAGTEP